MFPKVNSVFGTLTQAPGRIVSPRSARRNGIKDVESLFKWTRDRFMADEANFMAMHRVDFNADALARAASRVSKNSPCKDITKISENSYHKCYELLMENGRRLIAKIPLPHVSIPHLTCANQVATMDFARSTLKVPAPKVLDWNSRLGSANPVGAEYILMQKLPGVPLDTVWDRRGFGRHHVLALARQIFQLEKSFLGMTFRSIGAIYYSGDVTSSEDFVYSNPGGREIGHSRFDIGPMIGPQWVSNGRCKVECDRGPWASSIEFLTAIIKRELQAVDTAPQISQSLDSLLGPGAYRPTAAKKHLVGSMCLQLLEHIIPTPSSPISQYHLWHNRIDEDSILVDINDPGKITGITGWDNAQIAPLFKQTIWPNFAGWDHNADAKYGYEKSPGWKTKDDEPFCNDDKYDELSKEILRLHQRPDTIHADRYQSTTAGFFLERVEYIFDDEEADMAHQVISLQKRWKKGFRHVQKRSRGSFPVKLTRRRIRTIYRDLERYQRGSNYAGRLRARMKKLMPWLGAVSHTNYGKSKKMLNKYKKLFVCKGWVYEKDWPWDS